MSSSIYIREKNAEMGIRIYYYGGEGREGIHRIADEIRKKAEAAMDFLRRAPEGLLVQIDPEPEFFKIAFWEGVPEGAFRRVFSRNTPYLVADDDFLEDLNSPEQNDFFINIRQDCLEFPVICIEDGYRTDIAPRISLSDLMRAFNELAETVE